MPAVTRLFRIVAGLILLAMLILAGIALITQEPPEEVRRATQLAQTVQARVDERMTAAAAQITATPPPGEAEIEATVEALLTATPAPPPQPDPLQNLGGGIWSILRGLWDLFAFGGLWLQICCCLLIPGGVLLLFISDIRPRR
jgi:hypothetical protein